MNTPTPEIICALTGFECKYGSCAIKCEHGDLFDALLFADDEPENIEP